MKRVPMVLQSSKNECGLACLTMIAATYDGATDLAGLRGHVDHAEQGLTMKRLLLIAQELGYVGRGVRLEPEQLRQLQMPAVLHWQMDHFVVLVKVRQRGCLVHDPAVGRQWLSWQEVTQKFTGVALELWPGAADLTPVEGPKLSYTHIFKLAGGFESWMLWVLLLSVALQAMVLVAPWQMQWTVDEALIKGDVHLIGVLAMGFGLVLVCRALTHYLRGLLVLHLGYRMSFRMANRLFQTLLSLPLPWFEARHVGDIVSRFAALQPFRQLFTQGLAAMAVDLLVLLMSLCLMLVYSVELAILVLAIHVGVLAVYLLWVPKLRQLTLAGVVAQAEEQSSLLESVRGVQNVKVYAQESNRLAHWQVRQGRTLTHGLALERIQHGLGSMQLTVAGFELIATIFIGAHKVMDGVFTLGMLFAFITYRGHFSDRLRALADQLINLRTLPAHLDRLSEVLCTTPERSTRLARVDLPPAALALEKVGVRSVSGDAWLFEDISLKVPFGTYVGILGPSGCGKTTLLKTLMGLVPVAAGHIRIGSMLVGGAGLAAYRSKSGCVMQADGFFSGSLIDNITLFEPPDYQAVQRVVAAVDMQAAIAQLPMGWHTPVGDFGAALSTGQHQRLLLARALYRQPDYLFLDECTANLDKPTALKIQALIAGLTCTRIVVAHDPELLAAADVLYRLDGGCLLEIQSKSAAIPSAG